MLYRFLNRHRGLVCMLLLVVIASFLMFICCDTSWARAGGGGGYRGGGGYSGGGGGDGGGLFILIWLVLRHPVIGIPVLIIVGIFSYYGGKQGRNYHVTRTIRRYNQQQDEDHLGEELAKIQERDPEFDADAFLGKVSTAFLKIQDAWSSQNMVPVRHFVSDGVFERFSLQLDMMKQCILKNMMQDVQVIHADIVSVESDSTFDSINVKIFASAVDYSVDLENNQMVDGSSEPDYFTEFWTFLRRPGAKTVSHNLVDNCCPNCGALLDIVDKVECPSCNAVVNSGDYDWVLTEITQESEWTCNTTHAITGADEMRKKDPAFNVNHIEDRVSVMFYRWISARFFADSKYIAKLATESFISEHKNDFTPQPDGSHEFYADAAVGAVETIDVERDGEFDRVRVRVRWSGHLESYKLPRLITPDYDSSRIRNHEFVLIRKSNAVSSDKNVLSSTHCPNCGAPEVISDKPFCEYCHTPLNDGSRDWVLEDIRPFGGYRRNVLTGDTAVPEDMYSGIEFMDEEDAQSLLACAAGMMIADRDIDMKERILLNKFASLRGISPTQLNQLVESVKEGSMQVSCPQDPSTCVYFLKCLILMCLADGKVTGEEKEFLYHVAGKMNIDQNQVNQTITDERHRLYHTAKKSR